MGSKRQQSGYKAWKAKVKNIKIQRDCRLRSIIQIHVSMYVRVDCSVSRYFTTLRFTCVTGHYCEWDVDECESEPCMNGGQCYDLIDNFACYCPPGKNIPSIIYVRLN